ncbi:hypothetical protein [Staphylococcus ratti]|uniref:Uncharacterized protein n=1 Tax=Staphylococcus ratti TaxID=2892440 RepID=A0ABY3PD20_9STAP|nr:hypothetical protein [Staphylococcus ratti]UEX90188.1 hypothetical protein LN051_00480 [Staphylococcus ratti]
MFLKERNGYEQYAKVSKIMMAISMSLILLALVLKLLFAWTISSYIIYGLFSIFILSLIIDAIPDFLRKNVTAAVFDVIFIGVMIWILFYANF